MLHKMAARLHTNMQLNGVQPPSEQVIVVAFHILLNTFSIVILALAVGLILGNMPQTLVVLVIFALIRFISGGYHLSSNLICIVTSTVTVSVIPLIQLPPLWITITTAFSFVMMAIFAPANYDQYARISKRYYPLMKVLACAIVAANFFMASELLAVIFTVQSFFLPIKMKGGTSE